MTKLEIMQIETAKQNQKIPFHSLGRFAAEGWGEEAREKCKEIFGFARTSPRARPRRVPAQVEHTWRVQATTRSARAKWVRAKVIHSPQIETSSLVRAAARSAAEEWAGRKPRREAAKVNGAAANQTEKMRGIVSLVSNLKSIYMREPKYFLYARKSSEDDDR
jgi:hypothetical protein